MPFRLGLGWNDRKESILASVPADGDSLRPFSLNA